MKPEVYTLCVIFWKKLQHEAWERAGAAERLRSGSSTSFTGDAAEQWAPRPDHEVLVEIDCTGRAGPSREGAGKWGSGQLRESFGKA